MNVTFDEARKWIQGELLSPSLSTSSLPELPSISTDTRTLRPGQWFFALRGENFDAHDYLDQAVAAGASVLVVHQSPASPLRIPVLLVSDTLYALGEIARCWRSRNSAIRTVSVVGSSGKTTTKEMTAGVISNGDDTLVTRGNLNNLIGLPHMIFDLSPERHKRAVLELGMNMPGELKRLMEIAQPDCLVLTNITNAHIGMFGSQEALYMAKTDSIRGLRPDATLIVNADDPLSVRGAAEFAGNRTIITYGLSETADVRALDIEPMHPFGYRYTLAISEHSAEVELGVFGRHNIHNSLAAAAVGMFYGITAGDIARRLSAFQPKANRSEVESLNGWFLVKDYYNASPSAVEAALRSLVDFTLTGRRVAVLADMMELGEMEREFHERIGDLAAELQLDHLITLGQRGKWISDAAASGGIRVTHLPDIQSVARTLHAEMGTGDLLLIKGSRVMKLEQLYELLKGVPG